MHDKEPLTYGMSDLPPTSTISAAAPWTVTVKLTGASTMDFSVSCPTLPADRRLGRCRPNNHDFSSHVDGGTHVRGQALVFVLGLEGVTCRLVRCTSVKL
jgi:hypothetical protein